MLSTTKSSMFKSRQVPFIIDASVTFANYIVFDVWQLLCSTQTSEIYSIRSKYRDAGEILKGIGGGQGFAVPSVVYALSSDGDKLTTTASNLTSGSSDQDAADEVDEASPIDST